MEGCKMVKPYLNQVGGKVENDVNLFTGGLNTYVDKGFIDADQMPYVMNMTMETPPAIKTRRARRTIAEYMEGNRWAYNIGDIVDIWAYSEDQIYLITDDGGLRRVVELYRNGGDQYTAKTLEINGSPIAIPAEDRYYFTLARTGTNDWVYITGLTFKLKLSINPNPLFTQAEFVEDGHYGIACCHKGRLFLGMPNSNIVTFSALYDYDNFDEMVQYQLVSSSGQMVDHDIIYLMDESPTIALEGMVYTTYHWDEDQDSFISGPDDYIPKTSVIIDTTTGLSVPDYSVIAGDFKITNSIGKLISLKSFDDKLIIFCEHSMHVMYGDTPDTSMQNQYQLVDLNNNLGALCDRCITIGGGRLFWLGDNNEVYEYTGASINIISRPGKTRNSTLSLGGISGVIEARDVDPNGPVDFGNSHSKFVCTSEKLYINIWNKKRADPEKLLFVFDIFNRTWWCEDGEFNTIGNYSFYNNRILLGTHFCDVLINNMGGDVDVVCEMNDNLKEEREIEYEFHTRVYGADGTDTRKSLSEVWLQARALATVYIDDIWTSIDKWSVNTTVRSNLIKIGDLKFEHQTPTQDLYYRPDAYEQQVCYVEKMFGQRLNAFQIVIKGKGASVFYIMKREWRAR